MSRKRCHHDAFFPRLHPSQGQHALHARGTSEPIQCTGIPDNGDPSWMGQTLEGWWLLGKEGQQAGNWIELPQGMDPATTHVRLGVNNEVPTDKVDPPRLPNQIELPYSALAWAAGRCSRTLNGKHQFLCSKECFGDPWQGYAPDCAVARSAWVAKNPRRRFPATPPKEKEKCIWDYDCAPVGNRGGWTYTRCDQAHSQCRK
jgi:hypothetical protein